MKTIIIPLTDGSRPGIDDLLDGIRQLFLGTIKIQEVYVLETDNPGVAIIAEALTQKSGIEPIKPPSNNGIKKHAGGRPKNSYAPKVEVEA